MSWDSSGSKHVECPYCDCYRKARGMYWHLVIDYKECKDDAYDIVGGLIWDKRVNENLKDFKATFEN